jgi:hypothetical protein
MQKRIPREYRISPERVPVLGASITEGVGIGDLPLEDPRRIAMEVDKDEDKTLAYTALGLAGLAIAVGGYRATKYFKNKKRDR